MIIPELQTLLDPKERVKNLTVGRSISWKPFLITYEIYRVDDYIYELSHTSDGWMSTFVDIDQLYKVIEGEIKLSNLNWR